MAWLFARSTGSDFLVRVEDLDPVASRAEHEAGQLADLAALGLDWDGDVVRQSARRAAHEDAVAALEATGRTYPCYCTRREIREAALAGHGPSDAYPGTCRGLSPSDPRARRADGRPPALRLDAGGEVITVVDRVAGAITLPVDDFVLRRNDGVPAYNVAVVVDDAWQGVGEVVRGDDLLDSTPRQVVVAQLLGLDVPSYAHVPLVLGPDGERLAKRHGAVTLPELAARGQDAVAVRARLAASVGLCRPADRPTVDELLAAFDASALPVAPWTWEEAA